MLDVLDHVRRRNNFWRAAVVGVGCCFAVEYSFAKGFEHWGWLVSPVVRRKSRHTADVLAPTGPDNDLYAGSSDQSVAHFRQGAVQVRRLLDEHGVGRRELLVYHSAPLYYPMLDREVPTPYYCLGWAMSARRERDLIADLENNHVRAFLHTNAGLTEYDVPDSHRVPLVDRYINERLTKGDHFETPLGTLTIIDKGK